MATLSVLVATGCLPKHVYSEFGSLRGVNGSYRQGRHAGVDFVADQGTPVLAAADGTVVGVYMDERGCGLSVLLEHGDPRSADVLYTVYCHLRSTAVENFQQVRRGEVIGEAGMTGSAGGRPHVHMQLCRYPCYAGTPDGELERVLDPLEHSAGCFTLGKQYPKYLPLTYPIPCQP